MSRVANTSHFFRRIAEHVISGYVLFVDFPSMGYDDGLPTWTTLMDLVRIESNRQVTQTKFGCIGHGSRQNNFVLRNLLSLSYNITH